MTYHDEKTHPAVKLGALLLCVVCCLSFAPFPYLDIES